MVSFSPDSTRLVSASNDNTVRIWNLSDQSITQTFTGREYTDADFDQDIDNIQMLTAVFDATGTRVLVSSTDRTAQLWDIATGKKIFSMEGHRVAPQDVRFSPDNKWILTTSLDSAALWDADTGEQLAVITPSIQTAGDTFSRASARVFGGAQAASSLGNVFGNSAFTPDGQRIISSVNNSTAKMWEAPSGREVRLLEGNTGLGNAYGGQASVAVSPVNSNLIAFNSADLTIRVWDESLGVQKHSLQGHERLISVLGFTPDGRSIVTASWDATVRLWDVETGKQVHDMRGHLGFVNALAISPGGRFAASGDESGLINLWDLETGKKAANFKFISGPILNLAFSPDERWLARAGLGQSIILYDMDEILK